MAKEQTMLYRSTVKTKAVSHTCNDDEKRALNRLGDEANSNPQNGYKQNWSKRMKKSMSLIVALCCFGLISGALRVIAEEKKEAAADKKETLTQSAFVCSHCNSLGMKAGKCGTCKNAMEEKHVLGVKDGKAMLCSCASTCTCNAKEMKDGKCGCEKKVKTVSAKGMYVCPDGCTKIADKPCKCPCGKELKKVE